MKTLPLANEVLKSIAKKQGDTQAIDFEKLKKSRKKAAVAINV